MTLVTELDKLKNYSIGEQKALETIIKNSIFIDYKGINENLLDEGLNKSAEDIKILIVRYFGHYKGILKFWKNFSFKWKNFRVYNWVYRNENNCFPLLTELVKKIYKNFEISKTGDANFNFNDYIRNLIFEYFDLPIKKKRINKDRNDNAINTMNCINSINTIDNMNTINNKNILINDKDDNLSGDSFSIFNEKSKLIEDKDDDFKQSINEKVQNNNESFTINKFQNDYSTYAKLFWDSSINFEIERNKGNNERKDYNYIETELLDLNVSQNEMELKRNELKNNIFSEKLFRKNVITTEKIINYTKKFFGYSKIDEEFTNEFKMIMKIFFISYISNEVIDDICKNSKEKGFKPKSICDFFYNVLKSYNDAIEGFDKLKEEFRKEKNDLNACEKEIVGQNIGKKTRGENLIE